jgi:5-methylcytosine-specific restriction endonuclease McrA
MDDAWRYPSDWRTISRRIRERDGFRCRWCGTGNGLFDFRTGQPVRLTTMHLDGDPNNSAAWNLVSACRSCHAAYDAPEVTAKRAVTRQWTRIEAGQLELFPDSV